LKLDNLHFGGPLGVTTPFTLRTLHCTYTMPPYVYPLPTTTLLTFSSIFIDPSSTHTTVLADATSARTRLHLALKAVADQEPGSSALAVVEVCLLFLSHSLSIGSTNLPPVLAGRGRSPRL
jgi:hypothetical protein